MLIAVLTCGVSGVGDGVSIVDMCRLEMCVQWVCVVVEGVSLGMCRSCVVMEGVCVGVCCGYVDVGSTFTSLTCACAIALIAHCDMFVGVVCVGTCGDCMVAEGM